MINPYQNARTTVHSRELMVARHAEGRSVAQIADEFGVSMRKVYKWLRHFREGGHAALRNRPSAPAALGAGHPRHWCAVAEHLRREYRMTGAEIAERLHVARATVARWLRQGAIGRLKLLEPRELSRCKQRECPGELIHSDIKQLGRFERIGHRISGDRRMGRNREAVWDLVHVAIDDATRLAYVEVLPYEKRGSAPSFLVRALGWFRERGVRVERGMTDNGSAYVSKLLARALRWLGILHIRTKPYTPKTNGKVARFIQTLMREWAYAIPYPSSHRRTADLPRWLDWYNRNRQHSAIIAQPSLAALNNVMRTHT